MFHIRTVFDLGAVFGLSILGSGIENSGNATLALDEANDSSTGQFTEVDEEKVDSASKAVCGVWASEASLQPDESDTVLILILLPHTMVLHDCFNALKLLKPHIWTPMRPMQYYCQHWGLCCESPCQGICLPFPNQT